MREQPTAIELIEAVGEFLRAETLPSLAARVAFHTRVAANVLDIVRRELTFGPDADRSEAERLRALVGHDGEHEALNTELCDLIASDAISRSDPRLIDHLWATTLATLSVDQPNYATYRRAAETREIIGR